MTSRKSIEIWEQQNFRITPKFSKKLEQKYKVEASERSMKSIF